MRKEPRRITGDDAAHWNRSRHHRTDADERVIADRDRTDDRGSRTNVNSVAYHRTTIHLLTSTATMPDRYTFRQGAVGADDGSRVNNDVPGMGDVEPRPDLRSRG